MIYYKDTEGNFIGIPSGKADPVESVKDQLTVTLALMAIGAPKPATVILSVVK